MRSHLEVTKPLHLRYPRLPSALAAYPRVMMPQPPPVTDVSDPPEISATVESVSVSASNVAKYLKICGFEPGSSVPITYPHILAMPLHLKIMGTNDFQLRPGGLIHLSNEIQCLAPINPGSLMDISVTARNYRPIYAGLAFDMATEITRAGKPVWRETCVFVSPWPDPATQTTERPPRPPRAPKTSEVLVDNLDVTMSTAWNYALASSDFNPIHLEHRAARLFGLKAAIVHGMWTFARSLAAAPAPSFSLGTRVATQWLTPVQMPAQVAIKQWSAAGETHRALCDAKKGRVHMYTHWPEQSL